MGFLTVLILAGALALSCFIVGNLPLSFSFSKTKVAQLSTLGVGLLLGAALGVIIPEGIETIYESSPMGSNPHHTIAISLLSGFTLMLVVEQVFLSYLFSSSSVEDGYALAPGSPTIEGARPSSNLHSHMDPNVVPMTPGGNSGYTSTASRHARSITFGLVIHSLADGLALGASSFSTASTTQSTPSVHQAWMPHFGRALGSHSHAESSLSNGGGIVENVTSASPLTIVVFLALLIHKIPAALALATSLLPLIPPRKIRVHIAIFSAATPLGAILGLTILGIMGAGSNAGAGEKQSELWAGMALAFSGGTFLYVATVLQPVRSEEGGPQSRQHSHVHPGEDEVQHLGTKQRVLLIIFGMFLPIVVSLMIGHGREQGAQIPG